jgi:hypothetical protein
LKQNLIPVPQEVVQYVEEVVEVVADQVLPGVSRIQHQLNKHKQRNLRDHSKT